MLAGMLIIAGSVLMLFGVLMLSGWLGGKSAWFDAGVYDRPGSSKTDRMFLDLYFLAMVIAPLLIGAIMIVLGLRHWS